MDPFKVLNTNSCWSLLEMQIPGVILNNSQEHVVPSVSLYSKCDNLLISNDCLIIMCSHQDFEG